MGKTTILAGVFLCFTLTIMMTKIRCMHKDCYTLDIDVKREICDLMDVRTSWSMTVGWTAFGLTALTVISWLYLSRFSRLELSKSVIWLLQGQRDNASYSLQRLFEALILSPVP